MVGSSKLCMPWRASKTPDSWVFVIHHIQFCTIVRGGRLTRPTFSASSFSRFLLLHTKVACLWGKWNLRKNLNEGKARQAATLVPFEPCGARRDMMSGGRSFPWSRRSWTIPAPYTKTYFSTRDVGHMHRRRRTGVPKCCSASHTYLPNRNRVKHSSVFTSKASPASSEVACQRMLC
jgi:hypothetical protein